VVSVLVGTNDSVGEACDIIVVLAYLTFTIAECVTPIRAERNDVRAVTPGLVLDPVNSHNAILSRNSREVKPSS
jgi:hypothetical protein